MERKELVQMLIDQGILQKTFDNIRLVDPINKLVVDFNDKNEEVIGHQCFDYWGKNKICDNCISILAYNDNRTYIKLEYTASDEIYVVTAIPVELGDRLVIIEILMNATDSLVLDMNGGDIYTELHDLIDKMNNQALKDALTGAYNRRFINEKLPIDVANAAISNKTISIIMADIDFFKKVNDTYGHLNGDSTLKQFVKIISQCIIRGSDWMARYGGEEFLICLPGASHDKARAMAEEMRQQVENTEIICGKNKFKITASFGVSTRTPEIGESMDELIAIADAKLYEAKHNGRNRVSK